MKNKYAYTHKPVLLVEALEHLQCRQGSTIVDCTLGGAGQSVAIAEAITPDGTLVGLDVDNEAIKEAKKALAPFGQQISIHIVRASYTEIDDVLTELGTGPVNGFLFDLGISLHHVEDSSRGFSYKKDGPLDMRMDLRSKLNAEKVVNEYDEENLARIIKAYGQEKFAKRIARFIVERRKEKKIKRTLQLVEIIKDAIPARARRAGPHPAKRTFQALRLEVNKELENVRLGMVSAIGWLKEGGRMVVISYHSLEDRIVKSLMKSWQDPCTCPADVPECRCGAQPIARMVAKKPITPSKEELEKNPRSRSAKMRVVEKI